ncbi:Uncharacterized protein HZ326_0173 [Fusarium oxysporum f. sp. albedinis]|nr:Uncharacterized protein HZ326_0173 [Fusarium oxysporum f. sp. albedinis]
MIRDQLSCHELPSKGQHFQNKRELRFASSIKPCSESSYIIQDTLISFNCLMKHVVIITKTRLGPPLAKTLMLVMVQNVEDCANILISRNFGLTAPASSSFPSHPDMTQEITKLTTAAQPPPAVTSPSPHHQTSTQPSISFGPIQYLHHLDHPLQVPFSCYTSQLHTSGDGGIIRNNNNNDRNKKDGK